MEETAVRMVAVDSVAPSQDNPRASAGDVSELGPVTAYEERHAVNATTPTAASPATTAIFQSVIRHLLSTA